MTNHPNRSRRADAPARNPSAEEVRALRGDRTQATMARMAHVSLNGWQKWEQGDTRMPPATWELLRLKLGLLQLSDVR